MAHIPAPERYVSLSRIDLTPTDPPHPPSAAWPLGLPRHPPGIAGSPLPFRHPTRPFAVLRAQTILALYYQTLRSLVTTIFESHGDDKIRLSQLSLPSQKPCKSTTRVMKLVMKTPITSTRPIHPLVSTHTLLNPSSFPHIHLPFPPPPLPRYLPALTEREILIICRISAFAPRSSPLEGGLCLCRLLPALIVGLCRAITHLPSLPSLSNPIPLPRQ